jgi:hypothetical protein
VWIFVAAASVTSCQRCGGGADPSPGASASAASSAEPAPTAAGDAPEVPEIKDTGPGRATAALRAALKAYGIAFDEAAIARDCKVDDDGASIDDLEDVADAHGLAARQIIVPREHVLLPEAKLLPGLVIVAAPDDDEALDFVLVWKVEGDRALVMDPGEGKRWVPRADLAKRIWVHEMTIAAEDWRAAETDPRFRASLAARMAALGVTSGDATALLDRAAGDPGARGLGALDAAIRTLEAAPRPAAEAKARFTNAIDCAIDKRCQGEAIARSRWSSEPRPDSAGGLAETLVRGAVMLTIAGKKEPAP